MIDAMTSASCRWSASRWSSTSRCTSSSALMISFPMPRTGPGQRVGVATHQRPAAPCTVEPPARVSRGQALPTHGPWPAHRDDPIAELGRVELVVHGPHDLLELRLELLFEPGVYSPSARRLATRARNVLTSSSTSVSSTLTSENERHPTESTSWSPAHRRRRARMSRFASWSIDSNQGSTGPGRHRCCIGRRRGRRRRSSP